jgi:hypothetical protein
MTTKQLDSHSSCSLPKKLQRCKHKLPHGKLSFRGKTNKSVADICRTYLGIPFHSSTTLGDLGHPRTGRLVVGQCICNCTRQHDAWGVGCVS